MIGALSGTVASISGDQLIIDVNGVGYEVSATRDVFRRFGKVGESARIVIYTDVKENSILLYGFGTSLEKQVFLLLRRVKGIGSKIALATISTLGAEEVLSGIGRGDISAFRRVSGVGGKTAERVIVELREAVAEFITENGALTESGARPIISRGRSQTAVSSLQEPPRGVEADVILALERLGFPGERARQVVTLTIEKLGGDDGANGRGNSVEIADSGELLRLALANIQ